MGMCMNQISDINSSYWTKELIPDERAKGSYYNKIQKGYFSLVSITDLYH